MDPFFEKNLIPTKEAAELSGYTSDYIARLARSGKISGHRIGHTWFVDTESLTQFLDQQEDRKIDYARALARAREVEYRAVNSTLSQVSRTLTKSFQVPEKLSNIADSLRPHAFALSTAFVVVISGALLAHVLATPHLAGRAVSVASDISYGFGETFGDIPSRIAARIEKADSDIRAVAPRVAENTARVSANLAASIPDIHFSLLQMEVAGNSRAPRAVLLPSRASVSLTPITAEDIRTSVLDTYAFLTHPSHVIDSLARAYTAVGTGAYASIVASLSEYRSLIEHAGAQSLTLATDIRDRLATAPRFVFETNLAFGTAIIDTGDTAITPQIRPFLTAT